MAVALEALRMLATTVTTQGNEWDLQFMKRSR
jgi:hypothetical protein